MTPPSGINALLRSYRSDQITPQQFIRETYDRIEQCIDVDLWITLTPLDEVLQRVTDLTQEFSKSLPLYGIPFAIHDKIDGIDNPMRSTQVIKNLLAAGAILLGQTKVNPLALEFVHFVLGAHQEGDDRRSAILALTDSDVDLVLKSSGF
jgi:allophanate hydrolase